MGLSEKALTQLAEAGTIAAIQTSSGELLVAADNNGTPHQTEYKTKDEIIAEKFSHLRGQGISATAASRKYKIHHSNFINWARSGYIKILNEKKRLLEMDEADVAYCDYIYHQKRQEYGGNIAGVRIFDENGNPYQVKHPILSLARRQEKTL